MFCNFFSPSTFNFGISLGRPRSRLRLSGERAHAARARLRYSDILGADLSLRRTHENRQLIYPLRQPPPPQAENEKQSNQFIGADDFRRHFHIWNRSIILSQFWRQRKESHLFFHEIMRGLCIYPLSDRILGGFFLLLPRKSLRSSWTSKKKRNFAACLRMVSSEDSVLSAADIPPTVLETGNRGRLQYNRERVGLPDQ